MRIEAPPIKLPQSQRPARAPVTVRKRMDGLEAVMDDGRTQDRGDAWRVLVPPFQQLEHQT